MKENNRKAIARRARQRKQRARRVALTLCLIVATMLVSVGGTIAWLTATSGTVTNTFTAGDINITLTETTGENYKVIPGKDITKDPTVGVVPGSEACYLFVKIVEANWPTVVETDGSLKVEYAIGDGWLPLGDEKGVYYREVSAAVATAGVTYPVLKDNKVVVSSELTKTECKAINEENPTLTFTAYAVQSENVASAADAWKIATAA